MTRTSPLKILVSLFLVALLTGATPVPRVNPLWEQMRQGNGYVVVLRHAQTTPGTGDPANFVLERCETQRNLAPEGRAQAGRIGKAFRDQKIRVVRLLSSQYCRCLDTARLMGLGTVRPLPVLNSFFADGSSEKTQTQGVRAQILEHQGKSGVIVMVTHQVNITALSGIVPGQGDAVVIKADSSGKLRVVGQLEGKDF